MVHYVEFSKSHGEHAHEAHGDSLEHGGRYKTTADLNYSKRERARACTPIEQVSSTGQCHRKSADNLDIRKHNLPTVSAVYIQYRNVHAGRPIRKTDCNTEQKYH